MFSSDEMEERPQSVSPGLPLLPCKVDPQPWSFLKRFHTDVPYINRFIQPDSIIPNPANPQSFNRFSYVTNNPLNYTDPSGHQGCAWLGGCADLDGIAIAIELMADVSRGGNDILVAAGIAVQSQWWDPGQKSEFSGVGPAQLSRAQLDTKYGEQVSGSEQYGLGLHGEDPRNTATAVTGMSRRIYQVVNACWFRTSKDRLIIAAMAQNNGFTLASLKDVRTSYYDKAKGIQWDLYFNARSPAGDSISRARENLTGLNYDTEFMLLLYTNDLLELNNQGWELPFDLDRSDIHDIREDNLNIPRPKNSNALQPI